MRTRTISKGIGVANLYNNSGKPGYRYRLPNGKWIGMGKNLNRAKRLANGYNEEYYPESSDTAIDDRVRQLMGGKTIKDAADIYLKEFLRRKDRKQSTKTQRKRHVTRIIREIGSRPVTLERAEIAEFLKIDSYNHYRTILVDIFAIAVAEGWCNENEAGKTRKKVPPP